MSPATTVIPAPPSAPLSALDLIAHFPLPGLILNRDASPRFVNERCRQRIAGDWLAANGPALLELGANEQARVMQVPDAAGKPRAATVYATPLADQTVVVFDDRAVAAAPAQAAELQRRIFELERLSSTDLLTGLWNRRHFDEVVARELAFSERERSPVSLLLFDLDHFKQVNDRFGHAVGDLVLKTAAERLRAAARTTDQVFRWGGEEFAVLAPATSAPAATAIAERLRASVAAQDFPEAGVVTISAGVAEHLGAEAAQHWFERADAALYRAKEEGRDRVVTAAGGASEAWRGQEQVSALRLVWSDACVSGHALIDGEHRGLFDAANALIAAMTDSSLSTQALLGQLDALVAAVARHFVDEEQVLAAIHYPRLAEHQGLHARLLASARQLLEAVHAGHGSPGEVVEFLAYEVVNRHILKADRQFFPFLQGHPGPDPAGQPSARDPT
ncbi:MAG: diguanylate cyclase [Stagnimonas sp.]|nr:diguanylate cyclase [Stagnimonas sp.]